MKNQIITLFSKLKISNDLTKTKLRNIFYYFLKKYNFCKYDFKNYDINNLFLWELFYEHLKNTVLNRLNNICIDKKCNKKIYQKQYYLKNKHKMKLKLMNNNSIIEKRKVYLKNYYLKHKEKYKIYHRNNYLKNKEIYKLKRLNMKVNKL